MRLRMISSSGYLSLIVALFCFGAVHGKGNVFTYFFSCFFVLIIAALCDKTKHSQLHICVFSLMPTIFNISHLQEISQLISVKVLRTSQITDKAWKSTTIQWTPCTHPLAVFILWRPWKQVQDQFSSFLTNEVCLCGLREYKNEPK